MVGPLPTAIVLGKDFNFYQSVSITAASFGTNPDVMINFRGQQNLRFDIVSGSGIVSYSFNGSTIHGILTPSTTYNTLTFLNRNNKLIWFITSTSTSVIRVEAYKVE